MSLAMGLFGCCILKKGGLDFVYIGFRTFWGLLSLSGDL
jgi:hypothetical protein